jgi:hypothetical protein
LTWLLKVEVETQDDAEKIEKFLVNDFNTSTDFKIIDIEFEELEEDN